ncbi:MAG: HprK-related kinase A [Proteobacteria bacterium]|nr:HprK-related kinase A [Pseudomonadota bacterium]
MLSTGPTHPVLLQRIVEDGLVLQIGPFSIGLKIQETEVAREVLALYEGYPFSLKPELLDFRIELKPLPLLRAGMRRRIQAYVDHQTVFKPVPPHLGVPLLESAINWCIGNRIARYLLIHGAVVEREGRAVVLPGSSGAGKSTLTAALVAEGWRLLSDEVTIIDPRDGLLRPHPRPISLKNETIGLIASRYPQLAAKKHYEGTTKGRVAFLKAPPEAIQKADCPARPSLLVALAYHSDSHLTCDRLEKAKAFMLLARQSPSYAIMLERGFHTLANFVEACDHYALTYSDLDEAVRTINELSHGAAKDTQAA